MSSDWYIIIFVTQHYTVWANGYVKWELVASTELATVRVHRLAIIANPWTLTYNKWSAIRQRMACKTDFSSVTLYLWLNCNMESPAWYATQMQTSGCINKIGKSMLIASVFLQMAVILWVYSFSSQSFW